MQQKITVEGVSETVAILRSFDRDTLKAINKEIYQEVKPMVGRSRALVPDTAPMSGWGKTSNGVWGTRLLYDSRAVKMGVRTKIASQRQRGTYIKERSLFLVQADAAGSIYETAGRRTKGRTQAGKQFIKNLEDPMRGGIVINGKQSRVIWGVVYDSRKRVTLAVENIIRRYVNTYNNKMAA